MVWLLLTCTPSLNLKGRILMFSKKITLFIAANAMAFFLGAISVSAQTPQPQPPTGDTTTDGVHDGIPDFALIELVFGPLDLCPTSNLDPKVMLLYICY